MQDQDIRWGAGRLVDGNGRWLAYLGLIGSLAACSGKSPRTAQGDTADATPSASDASTPEPGRNARFDAGSGSAENGDRGDIDGGTKASREADDAASGDSSPSIDGGATHALYADATNGNDKNTGDDHHPFKTLKKALSVATSGETVRLFAGTYGSSNGDDYAVPVPENVAIETVSGNEAILDGTALTNGLTFSGAGGAKGLKLQNFGYAITVTHGTVTLSGLDFATDKTAIYAYGDGAVVADGLNIHDGNVGAVLAAASSLQLSTSKLSNLGQNGPCGAGAGLELQDVASLTLNNVTMNNINGEAMFLRDVAEADVSDCQIDHCGMNKCGNADVIGTSGQSSLQLKTTTIQSPNDPTGTIAYFGSSAYLKCDGDTFSGASGGVGLEVETGGATIQSTTFSNNQEGLTLESTGNSQFDVESCRFVQNSEEDLSISARYVRVRYSEFTSTGQSIYLSAGAAVDLGTSADPGLNQFDRSEHLALYAEDDPNRTTIAAAGNEWPSGTDKTGTVVVGPACNQDESGDYCLGDNVVLEF